MASEREIEQQQQESRRQILESEAALLLLLWRTVRGSRVTVLTDADIYRAAAEIDALLAQAYLAGRTDARYIGINRAVGDLDLVTKPRAGSKAAKVASRGISPWDVYRRRPTEVSPADVWRATRASGGYARAWADDALVALERTAPNPWQSATRTQAWRLEMGAATESAQAYGEGREQVYREFARDNPRVAERLFKVWDAELDKRTCQICAGAHGEIVPINESFSNGFPGGVHPRCRCSSHIVPISGMTSVERAALDEYWLAAA